MSFFKKIKNHFKPKEKEHSVPKEEHSVPKEIIMECDHCEGRGKIKYKREADGYEYRYGGYHKYVKWTEECNNCNGTGKVRKEIPLR